MTDSQNNTPIPEDPALSNNPFDPQKLRLSQNYGASAGVKKLITTIPVRKPGKQDFVRVHPDPAYSIETAVLEFKEEGETFLVAPELWDALPGELTSKALLPTINRQKVISLWPIRLPGEDGRIDAWNQSAMDAAMLAQKHWVRVSANMGLGAYDVYEATGEIPEPQWPELDLGQLLEIAFKGKFITDLNHPAIKRLRGE
ncbi:MAG TPA: hypothetical protein EYQ43_11810 [Methyloprofundus sp.]|nr:hypothetical protein [Methyloprofundus sp.]